MPAGRKLGFVPEEVVEAAMRVFWERGYTATTKTEIEAATGIARSSLANTFGSKEELFGACVDAFLDLLLGGVDAMLVQGVEGLEDIVSYFEAVAQSAFDAATPTGCLIVKTMMSSTECPPSSAQLERYRTGLLAGYRAALTRAVALGEIDAGLAEHYAELAYMWFSAINLTADSELAPGGIEAQLETIKAEIRSWGQAADSSK